MQAASDTANAAPQENAFARPEASLRQTCVRVLAAVPILALIGALPFVNRVQPLVFGLPFLLFWMLAWVMATPAFLGLAYVLERRGEAEGGRRLAEGGGHRSDDGGVR